MDTIHSDIFPDGTPVDGWGLRYNSDKLKKAL